ncbi:MAG: dihydropteroate synthase [Acidobacteria bacterium]|nr:dihydropteroate synthase [Acidobacteriota bacterium]
MSSSRKRYLWKLPHRELQLGDRTLIMGVLNVTPDSFSDGGQFLDPDQAVARALQLEQDGADIVDIGAESTRPGATRVSEAEEVRRLIPVLKRLRDKLTIPVCVDTYKSTVAERAIDLGVEIINDVSGLTFDPQLAKTVSLRNVGLILNHMRGTPETWAKLPPLPDPVGMVATELEAAVHRARRSGVEAGRLVIDPGFGFGKRKEENARLIAGLGALQRLDVPILAGPSRKSFLNQSTPEGLLMATAAAVALSISHGAHLVRVHDVRAMVPVVQTADMVDRATNG